MEKYTFSGEQEKCFSDLKSAARDMDVTADLKDAVNEARQGVNDVTNTVRSTGNDLKNTLEEHKKAN